jgi:X-X-X-Leu-X-X-Gly heptad repeat protein
MIVIDCVQDVIFGCTVPAAFSIPLVEGGSGTVETLVDGAETLVDGTQDLTDGAS